MQLQIPQIISNMIDNIKENKSPEWIRENFIATLEITREAIDDALRAYVIENQSRKKKK